MTFIESFQAAERAGVSLVVVRCPDPQSVVELVAAEFKEMPIVWWNICSGVVGVNDKGVQAAAVINKNDPPQSPAIVSGNPIEALGRILQFLPEDGIAFCSNLHIILESIDPGPRMAATQGVWNCRSPFKATSRMLVILCPDMRVPAELVHDVLPLNMPLPGPERLLEIVEGTFGSAGLAVPPKDALGRAVDALCGLSEVPAEQVAAMSLRKAGFDYDIMWDHKRNIIKQVGGLTVETRKARFDDLGGLRAIKEFARMIIAGRRRPRIVCLIDEIDRQIANINDSSGVGGDAYQQILSNIQDNNWQGMLFPGFGGTGKTELGNCIGTESGGLFIKFDLGGMQDKWVGESQKRIRAAMQMLLAMGGEDVLFIGTTNNAQAIRPELLRRFNLGQWFFNLPTLEEQVMIWEIYLRKFELNDKPEGFDCEEWTGGEIAKVSELAWQLGISLAEASRYIAPIKNSMGKQVKAMREQASGKYLSASDGGLFRFDKKPIAPELRKPQTKSN